MNCQNCNAEIKSGFLKSNHFLSEDAISLINTELNLKAEAYCDACGTELYKKAKLAYDKKQYSIMQEKEELNSKRKNIRGILNTRKEKLNTKLNSSIKNIPVLTTHTPYNWQYTSLELVSGQIVTGTGLVSEILSDVTDFFGAKSNSFTNKLTKSEEIVLNQLRAKAVELGGNAVIATDIDYGEVGADKGMLMVCAAGTAIILSNVNTLGENKKKIVSDITAWQNEKTAIRSLLKSKNQDIIEEYEKFTAIHDSID